MVVLLNRNPRKQQNSMADTGYLHDGRADKDSYPHDCHADKDSYPHDRHNQYITNTLC